MVNTQWTSVSATETNWETVGRWLLGEQPSIAPEHASERLVLGDNDRIGGWESSPINTAFTAVADTNTAWS